jgi:hypothetical protein
VAIQALYLAAGTALVAALCFALGRLGSRLFGRTPFWRFQVPWTAFHGYLVVSLYAGGGLPAPAGAFAAVLGLTLAVTLAGGLAAGVRGPGPEARALLLGWALPWALALLLAVL